MDSARVAVSWWFFPQNQVSLNTIIVDLHEIIEQYSMDENRRVRRMVPYSMAPQVSEIQLQPSQFTSNSISQLLYQSIENTQFCDVLSQILVFQSLFLPPGQFTLSLNIVVTREIEERLRTIYNPSRDLMLLKLMKEMRVGLTDFKKEEEEEIICSICLQNLWELTSENHAYVVKLSHCQHMFHEKCAFEWFKLNNSCPLCRNKVFNAEYEDFNETVTQTL